MRPTVRLPFCLLLGPLRPPPRANIDYSVQAVCKQEGLLKQVIHHKATLEVHQPPYMPPPPPQLQPGAAPVAAAAAAAAAGTSSPTPDPAEPAAAAAAAPLVSPPSSTIDVERSHQLTSCWCMRYGEVTLGLRCSTSYAKPGDVLTVRVKVSTAARLLGGPRQAAAGRHGCVQV